MPCVRRRLRAARCIAAPVTCATATDDGPEMCSIGLLGLGLWLVQGEQRKRPSCRAWLGRPFLGRWRQRKRRQRRQRRAGR